jgi:hypothetical protein
MKRPRTSSPSTSVSDSKSTSTYWAQSHAGGSTFEVYPERDYIASLKKAIKVEKPNACANVDADQITILDRGTQEAVDDPEQSYGLHRFVPFYYLPYFV